MDRLPEVHEWIGRVARLYRDMNLPVDLRIGLTNEYMHDLMREFSYALIDSMENSTSWNQYMVRVQTRMVPLLEHMMHETMRFNIPRQFNRRIRRLQESLAECILALPDDTIKIIARMTVQNVIGISYDPMTSSILYIFEEIDIFEFIPCFMMMFYTQNLTTVIVNIGDITDTNVLHNSIYMSRIITHYLPDLAVVVR